VKVTLRPVSHDPIDGGRYEVLRGADRFAWPGGPMVLSTWAGWDVVAGGHVDRHFRRMSDARVWLDSPEGEAWLDSLPKETVE